MAAFHGHRHVFDHLIEANGANVLGKQACCVGHTAQRDFAPRVNFQTTALHAAARGGQLELCRYIMGKGQSADVIDDVSPPPVSVFLRMVSVRPQLGRSPLHDACTSGCLELIRMLADAVPCHVHGRDQVAWATYDFSSMFFYLLPCC